MTVGLICFKDVREEAQIPALVLGSVHLSDLFSLYQILQLS